MPVDRLSASDEKVEKYLILRRCFKLYDCVGLNHYIPLTLDIDLRHQFRLQVIHAVSIRALAVITKTYSGSILQSDMMSLQSSNSDGEEPEWDEWQLNEPENDDSPDDTWDVNELSHHAWDVNEPSCDTWDVNEPSCDAWDVNVPSCDAWDVNVPSCDAWDVNEPPHDTWDVDEQDTWDVNEQSHDTRDVSEPLQDTWDVNEPSRDAWSTSQTAHGTSSANEADADYGVWAEDGKTATTGLTQVADNTSVSPTADSFVYEPGDPRKLYVNNAPYRSSQRELWNFFSKFGDVEYFQLLKTTNQKSKGRGTVKYKTQEEAEKVLQLSEDDLYLHARQMMVQPWKWKRYLKDGKSGFEEDKRSQTKQECCSSEASNDVLVAECSDMNKDGLCINDLNTDVLLMVFSHLTLCERVQAERVCKRWQSVLALFCNQMEYLSFNNMFSGFNALTDRVLRSLLKRGSRSLKSVNLSGSPRFLTDRGVEAIGNHCPNLVQIDMSGVAVTNLGLKKFAILTPQLQSITLQNCHEIGEMGLWWLFHKCKNLQHVDLTGNKRLAGKCLHVICRSVDTLILNGCVKLTDLGLNKISLRCKNICNLQLNDCFSLSDVGIQQIIAACPMISVFHLSGQFNKISSQGLVHLGKLVNLEELNLHGNLDVDNQVLQALAKCKCLRVLDITSCHRGVTHDGLVALAGCPCLQVLKMGYLHQVTDTSLQPLLYAGKLRELDARACGNLSDEVMQLVCASCPDLSMLDLCGCMQITNATWQSFETRARQTPDRHLLMHIGGTSIIPDMTAMPNNITLNCIDHSKIYLRQDQELSVNMSYYYSDDSYDEDEYDDSGDEVDAESVNIQRDCEDFAMSNEMAEFYLDADDPLAEEEWNLS